MILERTNRKLELAGNFDGRDTLGFETVGGIRIDLNRPSARHSEVSCCGRLWAPQQYTSVADASPRRPASLPIISSCSQYKRTGMARCSSVDCDYIPVDSPLHPIYSLPNPWVSLQRVDMRRFSSWPLPSGLPGKPPFQ